MAKITYYTGDGHYQSEKLTGILAVKGHHCRDTIRKIKGEVGRARASDLGTKGQYNI